MHSDLKQRRSKTTQSASPERRYLASGLKQPEVSVIIPVWNGSHDLRRCLTSLLKQTLSRDRYEIIVADNGSSDDSVMVARSFHVSCVVERTPGSYAARNAALSVAKGRFVAFTDSDCVVDPNWLARGLDVLKSDQSIGLVAGRIMIFEDGSPSSSSCLDFERIFAFNQEQMIRRGVAVTANWMSPVDVLQELGGFRADLKSGGDYEMARRIRGSGRALRYMPDMVVHHPARATFHQLASKRRRVVGGSYAGTDSKVARHLWRETKDAARRLKGVALAPVLNFRRKVPLSLLVMRLYLVAILEVVRLSVGGEPKRA